MRRIENILIEIENCIRKDTFRKLEDDKLDIKDNSHDASEWREIHKTICAFLNTNGGIIVIGIHEDENKQKFVLKGFDKRNEDKIKKIVTIFTNQAKDSLNLSEYCDKFEFHKLLDKDVLVIYIQALPEDKKYVFFEGIAYERLITGDHKISESKIIAQNDYKIEIQNAKELQPVINTNLENLDVNKLNEYIQLLNKEVRTENIKADIEQSKSFLLRKGFVTQYIQPSMLGILVCGNNIDDLIGSRCQVDCYVNTGFEIADNKKILKDNILPLMEKSINFIHQNIQVGVSIESGGKSIPEYPMRLIRESVNNSLAHRDYGVNKFININIVPNAHIEIRNPGKFKNQLIIYDSKSPIPIRRIIPGSSKPNNPKLAEILKVYDRWEGKGLGMSTLTNECLSNKIDLPYYKFHTEDDLSLYIPKGRLLDERMESLFTTYAGYIEKKLRGEAITLHQKLVLSYFYKSEIQNKNERYTILLTKDNDHLDAINTLEDNGLIIKHEKSNELYSVFVLDRNLFRKDFIDELRLMFGADFDALDKEGRNVLTTIYEFNNFSKDEFPSANLIGNTLWAKAGNANILIGFEDFKRKVRKIVNQMEKRGIVLKVDKKPFYQINKKFQKRPSIYDML